MSTEQINLKEKLESIKWDEMDNLINDGNCKISVIAKELGIPVLDLRKAFEANYGNRVVYKRGKHGGVYWSSNEKE